MPAYNKARSSMNGGAMTWILIILVLVLLIGGYMFFSRLDGLVTSVIEEQGSDTLQTSVKADDLAIAIRDGKATLGSLTIANPEGFSERSAMELRDFSIAIDLASLNSDTIVIDEVSVGNASMLLEQTASGSNLQTLLNNMQATDGSESSSAESEGPNISIKRFAINQIEATVDIPQLGKNEAVAVKSIVLHNLGGAEGASTQEIASELMKPLITKAIQSGAGQQLKSKAMEKINEQKDKVLKGLMDKLK